MDLKHAPFDAPLERYEKQAEELLEADRAGDPPAKLDLADARLAVARSYAFRDWVALADYVQAVTQRDRAVFRFESAVEAVITGDLAALASLIHSDPDLIRSRSTRVTCFDPPVHRATLLHYVAANGVEDHRQKSPSNAVDVAQALLKAGAEVDALADMYGGTSTTMSMLVSSEPPAKAGVQVALVDTLVDFGASVEATGSAKWASPLMTALAFGNLSAAEALVRRGARVECLAAAAGLGKFADATRLLKTAEPEDRQHACALAAQHGRVEIMRLLLDAGEDPNLNNPEGNHAHSTPLHQAVWAGHEAVVRLLVERGARLDVKDSVYAGTPLDWAVYAKQHEIEQYLRDAGKGRDRLTT